MEHFFLKGIGICFLRTVKLVAVENAFAAAAGRTDISAGIAADTFTQFTLEISKFFFRFHSLNPFYFCKTIRIFGIFGFTDQFIINPMLFAFADMAPFQHGITVSTCFFSVNGLHSQCISCICQFCTADALDSFNTLFSDFFNIQLSFTSHTNNVSFFSVYTVFFHQLLKAVCITWFQTNQCFSFQLGSFNHIFTQICSAESVIYEIFQRFFCLKVRRFRIVRQVSGFPAKHPGNGFVRQQFFCTVDYFLHLKSPNLTFFPRE